MNRFERRGHQLLAAQLMQSRIELLGAHYEEHAGKPLWGDLMEYMSRGPVLAMAFKGKDVVKTGRKMLGQTDPLASDPGTVRGTFGIWMCRNICHASDSLASAEREIALWFPSGICSYTKTINDWIYE